jgi:DNA replication protein DnaC
MFGKFERYNNASLVNMHKEAPKKLRELLKSFTKKNKDKFFSDKLNMYLYGSYRTGKTYFFHAVLNYIYYEWKEKSIYIISAPDLYQYFIHRTPHPRNPGYTWIDFLIGKKVLIIDGLGTEYRGSNSGFFETQIENFIRKRINKGLITMIESNCKPEDLNKYYGDVFENMVRGEFVTIEINSTVNMSDIILADKEKKK